MDRTFWLNRWKKAETGFHRGSVHPFLNTYWKTLNLAPGSPVLVPLCGKSSDMIWLADRGHRIIGSELSPVAIDAFFSGLELKPIVEQRGPLMNKTAGAYTMFQGDIFDLSPADVGPISAIYDRAALVALPPDMQKRYARLLATLAPPKAKFFLVSLDFDQQQMEGPPFSTSDQTVASLFSDHFEIRTVVRNKDALRESHNLKKRGLTHLTETLFVLVKKSS